MHPKRRAPSSQARTPAALLQPLLPGLLQPLLPGLRSLAFLPLPSPTLCWVLALLEAVTVALLAPPGGEGQEGGEGLLVAEAGGGGVCGGVVWVYF